MRKILEMLTRVDLETIRMLNYVDTNQPVRSNQITHRGMHHFTKVRWNKGKGVDESVVII